jgi:glycosyltransferase involved in cell wall biosynthesis
VRLAFWLPDIAAPTGGLAAAYRFARYLKDAGYDVTVAHTSGRFVNAFEELGGVAVTPIRRVYKTFSEADVIVVPEIFAASDVLSRSRCRTIVLNQNPFLTGPSGPVDATYCSPRTLGVVVTSRYTAEYITLRFPAVRVAGIVLGIDTDVFRPAPPSSPRVMSWMPRRRRVDAELVLGVLRRELADGSWVIREIDGLGPAEVAQRLASSSLYLAFGEREGFGLPLAEAMACGTPCVGFTGVGGDEILTAATGWPVPESDIIAFCQTVLDVRRLIEADDPQVAEKAGAARELITERYSRDAERESAVRAFSHVLGAS